MSEIYLSEPTTESIAATLQRAHLPVAQAKKEIELMAGMTARPCEYTKIKKGTLMHVLGINGPLAARLRSAGGVQLDDGSGSAVGVCTGDRRIAGRNAVSGAAESMNKKEEASRLFLFCPVIVFSGIT